MLDGTFDGVREGLSFIPVERRQQWSSWLDEAESGPATRFAPNGFTVTALQAAWSAIVTTPVPIVDSGAGSFPCLHLQDSLNTAIRVGSDTSTVAAIAGALLGARWGASAVPAKWRRVVHGWPSTRARDLVRLGVLTARQGKSDGAGWPGLSHFDYGIAPDSGVRHPADPDVVLGTMGTVDAACDAVVSLCRLGVDDVPAPGIDPTNHIEVWLIDSRHVEDNPNLDFVMDDAARAGEQLRDEGHRVLLHCVAAQSRTPTVAAWYGMLRGLSVGDAENSVYEALDAHPNRVLVDAVSRLASKD